MKQAVARRYFFRAEHQVAGFPAPWCEPHEHDYTVEVVAERDGPPVSVIVDTDLLDATWRALAECLEGSSLNETTPTSTTVEALSAWLLGVFAADISEVREVTVWEDASRWGRTRA